MPPSFLFQIKKKKKINLIFCTSEDYPRTTTMGSISGSLGCTTNWLPTRAAQHC